MVCPGRQDRELVTWSLLSFEWTLRGLGGARDSVGFRGCGLDPPVFV